MKRLWLCLGVSLLCHALFFPGLLQAMMTSGAANGDAAPTPARVKIRLTTRKPPPPVAVVKPVTPPPVARPKPKPPAPKPEVAKVTPPPKVIPQQRPRPRPVERPQPRPVAQPQPRPERVAAQPRPSTPHRGGGRSHQSTRRLSGSARPNRSSSGFSVPNPPPGSGRGQAGAVPGPSTGSDDLPLGEGQGNDGPPGPGPAPAASTPPSEPPPKTSSPPPPEPKTEPASRDPDPPPQSDPPKRSASAAPKMREASIEVPSIRLPANLRRDSLKVSLQVRAVIEADGSVDFKLGESSGNTDVDDYVMDQLRKVAVVTAALDDQGQPKKSIKRVRVDIEVD